jgi:hypothetical protein
VRCLTFHPSTAARSAITSDAGALLLGQTDRTVRLTERFAACFTDRLQDTAIADALQAIVDLDVDTLAAIELPRRGYGRD